ncbi:ABC transporter ATP-binding protein/permease [uncultured Clostridium sp.]|uniref:ABC transporter ATP-binding protein/permease n=1 Tax=uncultured Clostridium sp. TaxID=59620 RepID=UPI0025D153E2|nr:ABC transporter ATP-binding protein/permease [uncultured Clostridium sp.]
MGLLKLKNINKRYTLDNKETFHVLKDINVSFSKGELVSIIGESGSGKSTLMNLIGGLDSNFEGELFVNDKDINKFSEKELDRYRKNTIGFVFQSCNLIPHLSILDNVTIALTLSNVSKEERIEKAKVALKEVGLEKHIYKKPNQLSGGQRQRVAIARALINNPDIILADEPTGALDSETTEQVLNIIKDIASKGKLVIMVTHSEKVANHSSRVIKILDGKIIEDVQKDKKKVHEVKDELANTSVDKRKEENLSFISAIKLAYNNMKQKLKRNILVSIGVSIGIMSVIAMLALGNGVKSYFSDMIDSFMNPLVVEVSMKQEQSEPTNPAAAMQSMMSTTPFEKENIDELSKLQGVRKVENGFQYITMPGTNKLTYKDKSSDLMVLVSMSSVLTKDNVKDGSLPGKNEILVNDSVIKDLGSDVVGKTVTLNAVIDGQPISGDFVISGIYTVGESNQLSDGSNLAYINYSDIETLLSDAGKELKPTMVYLVADNEEDASDLKSTIRDLGYSGSTQETMGDQMLTMLNIVTIVLAGIAGISLLVSSIMILVVLYISVVERTKEIGLLRAIGARNKDIKRIFVSEAFLIGISSGILGTISSFIISILVNKASMNVFDMKVMNITGGYVIIGIGISVIVSMLAGLSPANKASKLDPVDSLRTE